MIEDKINHIDSDVIITNCQFGECKSLLELCPGYFPWTTDHLICPECGSTYIQEIHGYSISSKST